MKKTTDLFSELSVKQGPPSKTDFLSEYGSEDMELLAKKEAADQERRDTLRKKAIDEETKKKERSAKAENDFNTWMQ